VSVFVYACSSDGRQEVREQKVKYMLMFCKSDEDDRRFDWMTDAERAQLFKQVADWPG